MRHGDKVNNLGRKSSHRKAMISNMACSLIRHKRISTTIAKAKALKVFVEPILTKSKTDSTHSRRVIFSYLQDKEIITELFREVAPKISSRNGGYTRIIKTGFRVGDNAEMCLIELVDFNEIYSNESVKKTTRRSRRGGAKKTTEPLTDNEITEESFEGDAVNSQEMVADVEAAEDSEQETIEVVSEESVEIAEETSELVAEVSEQETMEVVSEETVEIAEETSELVAEVSEVKEEVSEEILEEISEEGENEETVSDSSENVNNESKDDDIDESESPEEESKNE